MSNYIVPRILPYLMPQTVPGDVYGFNNLIPPLDSSWALAAGTISSITNGVQLIGNNTASTVGINKTILPNQGNKKLYIRAKVKITGTKTSTLISVSIGGNSSGSLLINQSNPVKDTIYTLSSVVDVSAFTGTLYVQARHFYSSTANTDAIMEISEFMLVDLSSLFPVGLEPTKAQCDSKIPFAQYTGIFTL